MQSHHHRRKPSIGGELWFMDRPIVEDSHEDLHIQRQNQRISSEPQIEFSADIRLTSVKQSSSNLILKRLLIYLLTYLEGITLSAPNIPITLSGVPPFKTESAYDVPLISIIDPLVVLTFTYGAPQTLSVVTSFVLTSKYGILISRVQP